MSGLTFHIRLHWFLNDKSKQVSKSKSILPSLLLIKRKFVSILLIYNLLSKFTISLLAVNVTIRKLDFFVFNIGKNLVCKINYLLANLKKVFMQSLNKHKRCHDI